MKRVIYYIFLGFVVLVLLYLVDFFFIDSHILTPFKGRYPLEPLYSFFIPQVSYKNVLPVLIFLPFIVYLRRSDKFPLTVTIIICFLFTVLFRIGFSLIRDKISGIGTEFFVYPGEEFIYDAYTAANMGYHRFLATYPALMPGLSLHGAHFPPGNALLLAFLLSLAGGSVSVTAWVVVILASTFIIPVILVARRLLGSERHAVAAASLAMVMPSSVIFGAVSMDALYGAIACWPVCLTIYGFQARNRKTVFFAAGLLLGLAMIFSFSTFPLGLLLVFLFLLQSYLARDKRIIAGLFPVGLGFSVFLLLFYLLTGFDILACFTTALTLNGDFMREVVGQDLKDIYWYATYGNFTAFFTGAGFAVFGCLIGAVIRLKAEYRDNIHVAALTLSLLAAVLVSGVSGIYYLETERIWLFLAVWLVIPAAWYIARFTDNKYLWLLPLLLVFLQTLIQESLFYSLW